MSPVRLRRGVWGLSVWVEVGTSASSAACGCRVETGGATVWLRRLALGSDARCRVAFDENVIPVGLVFGLLRRYGGGFAGEIRRHWVCLGLRIPVCLGWCSVEFGVVVFGTNPVGFRLDREVVVPGSELEWISIAVVVVRVVEWFGVAAAVVFVWSLEMFEVGLFR
ncbi:hypothetical protein Droror1_Dr00009102 [Drosera rotundifolia]